ncbi:fasciclin domain-containing protein [Pinibacter aurantiacus]|uniref:Fasciclin domain-containing protein n=1 Tax=Pinibacter aurantiacus TaxID=2851599 RepID=A0A9E2S8P6_9BACT|nr:fasciclin domain-containing protein [Pinibacter aurantiacus]MBV4355985.1 fasciclin domain-containing protein [Pinibacter aurantiacus]
MRSTTKYILLVALIAVTGMWSCKKWDEHNAVKQQSLNETLLDQINKNASLSKFSEYLTKTGLDKVLSSSKNYTVFAPVNEALAALPAAVTNDTAKLKAVLQNMIASQQFFTSNATDSIRVAMLNGKRVFFYNKKFDDANITQADIFVRNGVLHIIDKAISPLPNVWDYVVSSKDVYAQNAYIASLNFLLQDPSKAELDSINPITGDSVYKPNTGMVVVNTFKTKVSDIANEDSLFTYIILANSGFNSEVDRTKPFFKSSVASVATNNASFFVVKDLAISGLYTPSNLPAALLSKFNVHVPISPSKIIESHKVSNGIVYVLSDAACDLSEKIPALKVEGENPGSIANADNKYTTKIFFRDRMNTLTGVPFKDIYLNLGSSGANYYVDYFTNGLFTAKYKVYWVAFNDKTISGQGDDPYGTDSTLQQILQVGDYARPFAPSLDVQVAVKPRNYNEVYLGEYTNTSYDFVISKPVATVSDTLAIKRIRLKAPATAATGVPLNLTLDYLKFVPSF